MRRLYCWLILLLLLVPVSGWPATYHVNITSGNDSTGDGSAGTPWLTLSHAAGEVAAGSQGSNNVIEVHADDTDKQADNTQAVVAKYVTIEGDGSDDVQITTTAAVYITMGTENTQYGAPTSEGDNVVTGIYIQGSGSNELIRSYGRNDLSIYSCEFEDGMIRVHGKYGYTGSVGAFSNGSCGADETETCQHCDNNPSYSVGPGDTDLAENFLFYSNTLTNVLLKGSTLGPGTLVYSNTWNNDASAKACIGRTGYFYKGVKVYSNTFKSYEIDNDIAVEMWYLYGDTQLYDNTTDGFFSLNCNYGKNPPGGYNSPYSFRVYDNTFSSDLNDNGNYDMALEVGYFIDEVAIYGNYFERKAAAEGDEGYNYGVTIHGRGAITDIYIHNNVFYNLSAHGVYIDTTINRTPDADIDNVFIYNNVFEDMNDGVARAVYIYKTYDDIDNILVKNNWCKTTACVAENVGSDISGCECMYNYEDGGDFSVGTWTTSNNYKQADDGWGSDGDLNLAGDRPDPYYRASSISAKVVDAGIDVGLPYFGSAPDVGAYEIGVVGLGTIDLTLGGAGGITTPGLGTIPIVNP